MKLHLYTNIASAGCAQPPLLCVLAWACCGKVNPPWLFPLLSRWVTVSEKWRSLHQAKPTKQPPTRKKRHSGSPASSALAHTNKYLGQTKIHEENKGTTAGTWHQWKHFQICTQHSSDRLSSWVVLFCSQWGSCAPVEDESHVQPQRNCCSSVSEKKAAIHF